MGEPYGLTMLNHPCIVAGGGRSTGIPRWIGLAPSRLTIAIMPASNVQPDAPASAPIDPPAGVRALIRLGRLEQAGRLLRTLLAQSPTDGTLLIERAKLDRLQRDQGAAAISYRRAARLAPDNHGVVEDLGGLLADAAGTMGPPLGIAPASPADAASADLDEPFVYVIGTSYARSFAVGTRYLPFMVGNGYELSFLTEESARRARRLTLAHLERLDLRRNLVLVAYGNADAITHGKNALKTKDMQASGAITEDSDALIRVAARRFCAVFEEVLERYPGIRLAILAGSPMLDAEMTRYVRVTNEVIGTWCRERNVVFVCLDDALTDPATGLLREEWCSFKDNPHLSKASVALVDECLHAAGVLPEQDHPYDWSYLMRFGVLPPGETRIWSEPHLGPQNTTNSRIVQQSHVAERAAALLRGWMHLDGLRTLLVTGCRDGLVPLSMPVGLATTLAAVPGHTGHRLMFRRIARFAGRSDILVFEDVPTDRLFDLVFHTVHADVDGSHDPDVPATIGPATIGPAMIGPAMIDRLARVTARRLAVLLVPGVSAPPSLPDLEGFGPWRMVPLDAAASAAGPVKASLWTAARGAGPAIR